MLLRLPARLVLLLVFPLLVVLLFGVGLKGEFTGLGVVVVDVGVADGVDIVLAAVLEGGVEVDEFVLLVDPEAVVEALGPETVRPVGGCPW